MQGRSRVQGMNCPHCNKDIDDKAIAAHMGRKGGDKSKRKISPEAQAKMQRARAKNKEGRDER